jgi:hypothetical protein
MNFVLIIKYCKLQGICIRVAMVYTDHGSSGESFPVDFSFMFTRLKHQACVRGLEGGLIYCPQFQKGTI